MTLCGSSFSQRLNSLYTSLELCIIQGDKIVDIRELDDAQLRRTLELYRKERDYQKSIFGSYRNNPKFNVATFILFIEQYIKKAKESYVNVWTDDLPDWLLGCNESENGATAPVEAYEALIKAFTLAGAALEAYADIDVNNWRKEGVKDKWKK